MGEVNNLVVVTSPVGNKDCERCGSCCKNIILKQKFSPEMEEWFIARGCGIMPDGSIVIPFKCPHLIINGKDSLVKDLEEGRAFCDIYKTRPKKCKEYQCWK